ncbi:hypothetical protein [Apilactobacillus kunkeei]|nr:hypothetical protein [Apilactobacillus kunkeei]
MTKIKIFDSDYVDEDINDWMKDKHVIDVQLGVCDYGTKVMVRYKENEE